ncbi:hypothetical protein Cni_G22559 [Canna indica]|uniref:Uncharacterized protein n=1 Tax=Canna indica TaxID=4628 RepID=A0AAQ3KSD4_9LILI|nr:hypothetical protein Cni_G22559 [Canna indica]
MGRRRLRAGVGSKPEAIAMPLTAEGSKDRGNPVNGADNGARSGAGDEWAVFPLGCLEPHRLQRRQRGILHCVEQGGPIRVPAGGFRRQDAGGGSIGHFVGAAGSVAEPRCHRRLPKPLRVELDAGNREGRGADYSMAAVRGATPEHGDAREGSNKCLYV